MSVEVPKPVSTKNFAPFAVILLAGFVASAIAADDATSKTLRFSKRQMFVSPYESCAVGDVNRDGKMDIVYGPYWFAGPDLVPRTFRPNHLAKEYIHTNSDHLLDVDG